MAQYILNNSGFVFFFKGRPKSVAKGTTQYAKILKAFDLPADQQDSAICDILDGDKAAVKEAELAGFSFKGNDVYVDGELLPQVLIDKINSLKREGLPITLFLNFWRNLRLNPSRTSILELYDFLAYKELPITQCGCFLAYRGLQSDFYSRHGNTKTKVLKGKVNSQGQIYNGVGEEIEIERSSCDDSRINCSSFGCHAGSYDYGRDWSRGKFVVVKINPKDVVSVPTDYSCQKLRCCAYTVISEVAQEILAPATDSKGNVLVDEEKANLSTFEQRISNYLKKKASKNWHQVSVKEIQNIFSPEYPDKKRVLAALDSLGYTWSKTLTGEIVHL